MLPADSYEIQAKDTLLDYSCLTKSTENLEPSEDGKIVFPQPNKIAFNWNGLLNFLTRYMIATLTSYSCPLLCR